MVSDYTRMSFSEVVNLDCLTFKLLLRDAFIDKMNSTEEGRELLEQAYMLEQNEPDRAGLRALMNKIGRR